MILLNLSYFTKRLSVVWLGDFKQGVYQPEISLAKEIAKVEWVRRVFPHKLFVAKPKLLTPFEHGKREEEVYSQT
jgi:hypothetical protein